MRPRAAAPSWDAPRYTNNATNTSMKLPHRRPARPMAKASTCPACAAMRVASSSGRHNARNARSTRPPSMGYAGSRLNPHNSRLPSAIRSARLASVGSLSFSSATNPCCVATHASNATPISRLTAGPASAIHNSSRPLGGRSGREMPPMGNITISVVRMPYAPGHQRVAHFVQQHGGEQSQNIERRHGARLMPAHPDEQQEHQQQDEGEVQAHRHPEYLHRPDTARNEPRLRLILVGHSAIRCAAAPAGFPPQPPRPR